MKIIMGFTFKILQRILSYIHAKLQLCMCSSDEVFQHCREGCFGVYFPSCEAMREINTKITLEWAKFILFLTRYNKSINDDKNDNVQRSFHLFCQ